MTKAAFDKIKAGLGEAKAYLDGSGNKRSYGIHVPARAPGLAFRRRVLHKPMVLRCRPCVIGSRVAGSRNAARGSC
jgi:uncharacterized phosphosugar-binding protein